MHEHYQVNVVDPILGEYRLKSHLSKIEALNLALSTPYASLAPCEKCAEQNA